MSTALTAVFAVTLHQLGVGETEPDEIDESLALLTRVAKGAPVSFESRDGTLYVNDAPVSDDAPGATIVRKALDAHGTARLVLPGKLELRHWREICQVFASIAALYPTADTIRDALRPVVPAAVVTAQSPDDGTLDLREAMFEIPGLMTNDASAVPVAEGLLNRSAERSDLSSRLDPILKEAGEAAAAHDHGRLAAMVLELARISDESDDATRTVIARERRRMVPQSVLEEMVRLIPQPSAPANIIKAVMATGRDGIEALVEAMSGANSQFARRSFIEVLTQAKGADEVILAAMGSARAELVRDAADIAGRRRMESAVQPLSHLLKHNDEAVRTAAWQALEQIGTGAALDALYGGPTAGRNR